MGAWATASLFIAGIIWLEVEANPQLFQNYQAPSGNYQYQPRLPRQQQFGFLYLPKGGPGGVAQSHSALGLQHQHTLRLTQTNFPRGNTRYDPNDPIDSAYPLYKKFEENFEKNLLKTQPQTFLDQGANDRKGTEDQALAASHGYDDYNTLQTTHFLGPHQTETVQSDHFHNKVPAFDVSEYQHHHGEKHGEVHYHQHKHIHNHEHKQEHVHQHKQDHEHKHLHHQQHKHDHHSEHKHGHEHKHDHRQEHKHDHRHGHKHNNHHAHKHGHHHGHKHQHHSQNKHHHEHGHKHGHKHGYKHQRYQHH